LDTDRIKNKPEESGGGDYGFVLGVGGGGRKMRVMSGRVAVKGLLWKEGAPRKFCQKKGGGRGGGKKA